MKQTEIKGKGSIEKLKKIIEEEKVKNLLIVCHQKSFEQSGAKNIIDKIKKQKDLKIDFFEEYKLNPKYMDIKKGLKLFEKNKYDLIIGIGGGSAIDVAKLLNIFSVHSENPKLYITKKKQIKNKPIPLVAIPTTTGTGSESTHFAVVYLNQKKYSVAHKYILPDYYILDSKLTMSLPKHQTACSGMDALSQGIESYWSINSTEKSKKYARRAIKLVYNNIEKAVNNPDLKSRENLLMGANYSGKAINISKTTAAHAFSYYVTTKCKIPHGHSVALSIGELMEFNYNKIHNKKLNEKRGKKYLNKIMKEIFDIFNKSNASNTNKKIKRLMKSINLNTDLKELCKAITIKDIIKNVNLNRLKNNPLQINQEDIDNIFKKII